jgi:hypothetical protein
MSTIRMEGMTMQGRLIRLLTAGLTALLALGASTASHAIPAWARQTDKACTTCHFQHYPALNDYGQEFKASGYTAMGKQPVVKGKDLNIPAILNASLFFKIRYQKTNGDDAPNEPTAASGEWQFPDEFALLFGGRITENVGYMLEGQLANGEAPFLAGFKMPFMFKAGKDVKVGIVPYTTDALGASYGFELLNTGAVRNVRIMEHRNESSAQQYIGTATPAMGAAFVAWHPQFFVNVTKWSPNHAAVAEERANGNPKSTYARAAWTPTLGDWSLGLGVQSWSGSSDRDDGTGNGTVETVDTKAVAFDAQAQGEVGGMPLGVYLTHAVADGSPAEGNRNLFNGNRNDRKATAITVELGIIPHKATLMFAYRKANTGSTSANSDDDAITIGGTYQYAQNVQLQLLVSRRDKGGSANVGRYAGSLVPGDNLVTFMLSAGF